MLNQVYRELSENESIGMVTIIGRDKIENIDGKTEKTSFQKRSLYLQKNDQTFYRRQALISSENYFETNFFVSSQNNGCCFIAPLECRKGLHIRFH